MKTITIYSLPSCPYCVRAKELFTALGAEYTEIDLSDKPEVRQEMSDTYNWQTVPMIMIGDEFIGGYDDLAKLQMAGELMPKIQS